MQQRLPSPSLSLGGYPCLCLVYVVDVERHVIGKEINQVSPPRPRPKFAQPGLALGPPGRRGWIPALPGVTPPKLRAPSGIPVATVTTCERGASSDTAEVHTGELEWILLPRAGGFWREGGPGLAGTWVGGDSGWCLGFRVALEKIL